MPHIYPDVRKLEGKPLIGDGNCVALVQQLTDVGWTGSWRPMVRVLDAGYIRVGAVIATFDKYGRYANRPRGNHAALFLGMGPLDMKTGRPSYILVMDQWKTKAAVGARKILPREKLKADGGIYEDSDNAETFWVVW